jgi:hypothetical protein
MEVLGTRVESAVLVIEARLSINLNALTIEEVIGKRQKVVRDMCNRLEDKAMQVARSDKWSVVPDAVGVVKRFLEGKLLPLAEKEAEHYNDNAPLGSAIQEAVNVAGILDGWVDGIEALVQTLGRTVQELVQSTEPVVLRESGVRDVDKPPFVTHCIQRSHHHLPSSCIVGAVDCGGARTRCTCLGSLSG